MRLQHSTRGDAWASHHPPLTALSMAKEKAVTTAVPLCQTHNSLEPTDSWSAADRRRMKAKAVQLSSLMVILLHRNGLAKFYDRGTLALV